MSANDTPKLCACGCGNAVKKLRNTFMQSHRRRKPSLNKKTGYILITPGYKNKNTLEHRYVWEKEYGPIPKGFDIHHINGIRTDNRLENLEIVSHAMHTSRHKIGKDPHPLLTWAKHFDRCVVCGTNDRPHKTHGRCDRCDAYARRHQDLT